MAGVDDSADRAVNARSSRQNHQAVEINRLGHFGDKGITAFGDGGALAGNQSQVRLGTLQKFMGLRASGNRGSGEQKQDSGKRCAWRHYAAFHGILRPIAPAFGAAVRELRLVT